ncbi:uncharacterized protein V6R79_005216, partial [Siganus canaliculatus]
NSLKMLRKNISWQKTFSRLGQSQNGRDELFQETEPFTCNNVNEEGLKSVTGPLQRSFMLFWWLLANSGLCHIGSDSCFQRSPLFAACQTVNSSMVNVEDKI